MQGSSDQYIEYMQSQMSEEVAQAIYDTLQGRTFAHKAQLALILTYLQEKKYKDAMDFIRGELTR